MRKIYVLLLTLIITFGLVSTASARETKDGELLSIVFNSKYKGQVTLELTNPVQYEQIIVAPNYGVEIHDKYIDLRSVDEINEDNVDSVVEEVMTTIFDSNFLQNADVYWYIKPLNESNIVSPGEYHIK